MQELFQITIILISSFLAIEASKKLAIPAVVGQLLVGIIIGPSLLNLVHQGEIIHFLSELGVILLMFLAGLEADLGLLKRYLKPSLAVAISGVIIPVGLFFWSLKSWDTKWRLLFFTVSSSQLPAFL